MINLATLFNLTLQRKKNAENYLQFQEYQASYVVKNIFETFKCTPDMTVLDFGCGQGGYSNILGEYFSHVNAVDFHVNPIHNENKKITYISSDLLQYKAEQVDVVFCASVIEHIEKMRQRKLIEQIACNLKLGGYLYLSFPPFYSPIGGHACAPFHYLPDNIAYKLTRLIKKYPIKTYDSMYGSWGLYRTSILEIITLLVDNGFQIISIKSRYMPEWYSKIFGKSNFLNWNAEFYCCKYQDLL